MNGTKNDKEDKKRRETGRGGEGSEILRFIILFVRVF